MRTCLNAQREIWDASMDEIEQVRAVHPELVRHVGPPCTVRNGLVRPRCTEGTHFCGVPVWRSFPDVERPTSWSEHRARAQPTAAATGDGDGLARRATWRSGSSSPAITPRSIRTSRCDRRRRRRGAPACSRRSCAIPDTAIFVAGDPGAVFAFAIAVRAPRAADPPRDVPRRDHRSLRRAGAPPARHAARARWRAATRWASARGAERVEVRVSPRNPEAQAFWRAQGYGAHMEVLHRRL